MDAIVGDAQFLFFFSFALIPRTAGLPQYGQLGHGTDNEVCSGMMFSWFLLSQVVCPYFNLNPWDAGSCILVVVYDLLSSDLKAS